MIVAYFWKIKPAKLPFAITAMGFDRFSLWADKNVSFHKSLGTGKGETFTPSDANALQWGLVAVVEDIEKFDSSTIKRITFEKNELKALKVKINASTKFVFFQEKQFMTNTIQSINEGPYDFFRLPRQ